MRDCQKETVSNLEGVGVQKWESPSKRDLTHIVLYLGTHLYSATPPACFFIAVAELIP